jgi:hypothetical protein
MRVVQHYSVFFLSHQQDMVNLIPWHLGDRQKQEASDPSEIID